MRTSSVRNSIPPFWAQSGTGPRLTDSAPMRDAGLYEVYESAEAVEVHKATEHYQVWTTFKDAGGVVSVSKMVGSPAAADWCFQA
jgi:hypothetical protein